jgi:hypothetical protein
MLMDALKLPSAAVFAVTEMAAIFRFTCAFSSGRKLNLPFLQYVYQQATAQTKEHEPPP